MREEIDDKKKILEEYGKNLTKFSSEALKKVSRKGIIITQDNRETITIPANIRQKKLIFLKSKRAQFNKETERHVSFWLNRRDNLSERKT